MTWNQQKRPPEIRKKCCNGGSILEKLKARKGRNQRESVGVWVVVLRGDALNADGRRAVRGFMSERVKESLKERKRKGVIDRVQELYGDNTCLL